MNTRINFSSAQAAFTLFFLFLFCPAKSDAAAVLDQSFGTNGTLSVYVGSAVQLSDIGVQTDGKIVVAGTIRTENANDIVFARFLPNGSPDTSFGNNGISIISPSERDDAMLDFEIQADGKIVAVGSQKIDPRVEIYDFLAFRINANGTLDTSFGDGGKVTINQGQPDYFAKVDIQPDGKIVAVGGTVEEGRFAFIVRFNANGSRDNTFGVTGITSYNLGGSGEKGFPSDVEVLPGGKILLGGALTIDRPGANDEVGFYEIRLLNDGALDTAFGNQGILTTTALQNYAYAERAYDAAVLPNGKIVKAGGGGVYVDNVRFSQDGIFTAILPDGKFAVSGGRFGGSLKTYSQNNLIGTAWNVPAGKIAAQSDGKILIYNAGTITRVKLVTSQGTRLANFNKDAPVFDALADDKTDFAVYRPGEKRAYILRSDNAVIQRTTISQASKVFPEFASFTLPIDSSSFREVLVNWHTESASNQGFFDFDRSQGDSAFRFQWGFADDVPFGGDFDGSGTFDVGVFRPSNGVWYGFSNQTVNQQGSFVQWGTSGDKPVPADYDFDGRTDYAVYRPSSGTWWILRSSDGGLTGVRFGLPSDIPVTGDFDADGKADFSVYRPSEGNWYQLLTTEGFRTINFGLNGDYPVAGDYDGDGRHDIALFRNGVWYVLQSRDGLKIVQWGANGDVPVAVRYDQ